MIPFELERVVNCGYGGGVIATGYRYIVQKAAMQPALSQLHLYVNITN